MVKSVETVIPQYLKNLGLKVMFGGDAKYHCIDTDGVELKSFDLKHQAIEYLRESFELEIEAQVVSDEDE